MFRENGAIIGELSEVVDLFLIGVGFYWTILLYQAKHAFNSNLFLEYIIMFLVYLVCWVISSNIYRVYTSRRFMSVWRELKQMGKAHFLVLSLSLLLVTAINPALIQNRFLFYLSMYVIVLMFGVHLLTRLILEALRKTGRNTRYVLVLGSGPAAKLYLEKLRENSQLGYRVIGYLAPQQNGLEIPYLGDYTKLEAVIRSQVVDVAVVTALLTDEGVRDAIELLDMMGKTVAVLLDDVVSRVAKSRPIDFDGLPMVAYDSRPRRPWQELAKRSMDIVLSGLGLIVLSPVMLIIAIAVKVTSEGPIIFAQERVGLNGRIFRMYKFRSMVVNAEELKTKLTHLNEMNGPVFKIKDDPRVTRVGRFLRKTSLDELPQLWNVFKGDMSLVGPRPPLPSEVNMYDPKHRKRLAVRPGITCIWQISGRNEVDFDQWMEMDAEYVDRWSLWLDIKILAKTVPVVVMGRGAS